MNTTPAGPHKREPKPPTRWWQRVNWTAAATVARGVVACGSIATGVYLAAHWLARHVSGQTAVWLCAAAVAVLGVAGYPLLRRAGRGAVGIWVRLVHRHRNQGEARLKHPRYSEIYEQPALLGISPREASRAVGLSARVFRWLQRHPGVLVHEELIRHLCEAMLLDPDYVRGVRHDFSDPYVERRLFHYWSRSLALAWTWSEIMEANPEARRQILASIEALRWAEIHAQNPGGDDA